jgi:hypothetical protein
VDRSFFEPYVPQLQAFADSLKADPHATAVIVGRADGARYADGNDAKNPGLSLGRAHALRNLLVDRFHVDSSQILIQTADVPVRGDEYRSVSVRLEPQDIVPDQTTVPVVAPIVMNEPPAVQEPPAAVNQTTNYFSDQMTLRLSAGLSSSPFGGLPIVSGAVIWKNAVSLELVVGHSFWSDSYSFGEASLSTWRRMVGGRLNVYPWKDKPVNFVAGWSRVEVISQSYYEYVRMSEGPVLGVTVTPLHYLGITGLYNPARQRVEGTELSSSRNGQFLLSISLFKDFGGSR